jgi:hypothetical protein
MLYISVIITKRLKIFKKFSKKLLTKDNYVVIKTSCGSHRTAGPGTRLVQAANAGSMTAEAAFYFEGENMNEITRQEDRRMTLRQVAGATGASYRTVAAYAQKAGWTENGKLTLLTEEQATVLVEAIKSPVSSGTKANLAAQMQGIETALTPALKLDMLYRQIVEIKDSEIARLNADLSATRQLLDYRTNGLETIQRIAEAGGLVNSDRDDVLGTYRRGR